jgi:hypothetical protein
MAAFTACCPRKTTAFSVISPWSLPKATRLPKKVTAPMRAVKETATRKRAGGGDPAAIVSRKLAPATSTEAPPPNPLNRATI